MSGTDARDTARSAERGELPRASQRWPRFDLACRVESYPDGDQCTIYPADAAADDVTTWITADAESFVDVTEMR